MTEIFFVIVIIVVLGVAFIVLSRRSGAVTTDESLRDQEMEEGVVSEPVPVITTATTTREKVDLLPPKAQDSRWETQFAPRSGALDDVARLKLINDLGMLRAAWCVPLLEQALAEERIPANRAAAQSALARCRDEVPR